MTDILGGAAVVHGADYVQAGLRQVWTGRETESGTELVAEGIARALGARDGTAEAVGDRVDLALGLGLGGGSASGIRALSRLAQRTGTVWDDIARSAGAGNWENTVVPRAFELAAQGGRNGRRCGSRRIGPSILPSALSA